VVALLGLPPRCRESGFRPQKSASFQLVPEPCLTVGRAPGMVDSLGSRFRTLKLYINPLASVYIFTCTYICELPCLTLTKYLTNYTLTTLCRWQSDRGSLLSRMASGPEVSATF
jgi:hypothetical protein